MDRRNFMRMGGATGVILLAQPSELLAQATPPPPRRSSPRSFAGGQPNVVTPNGSTLPLREVHGVKVGHLVASEIDHEFAQLKNLSFARVYGQALSEAVEIEKSSGPGALVFASDEATELLVQAIPDGGLRLSSNVLRWFKWENLDAWIGTMDI